ncbi:interleukin-6 receptor subunit beta-like [Pempheris klunzingeri]|uniref:interleukin-6 receptor subunit beta-like n=1 Tax=Pempheris klunzingeri TaxID=3127111 RepID=UPI0039817E93
MERSPAVVWTCLLGVGLILVFLSAVSVTTSNAVPRPLRLTGCVFLNRANVTCRWEAGDTATTLYTLQVEKRSKTRNETLNTFTCTTSGTSCTAGLNGSSVRFDFCVTITAHGSVLSQRPCQSGRTEVMLPAVTLESVKPVSGGPRCLNVAWSPTLAVFPVSHTEIKAGHLKSQIEFTAQGQFDVQVKNVTVTHSSFPVCLFKPDTSYTIRLRHRYMGPESPWSLWSNGCQGRTGEDAPSAAPAFWRRVKQTDKNGWRLISLLWKPLPHFLANGRVLFFNVTCQTESTQVLNDHGSCRDLHHTSTSCSLLLPADRCSCALTASTSAGASPEARMWLLRGSETEPPPLSQMTAGPLDDSSFDVRWSAPVDRLSDQLSGFVVEWFAVREKNSSIFYWENLNSSCAALVITEGVEPMERYVISVKALYGDRGAGQSRTVHRYTRQGAPLAGPKVEVQQISGSRVELSWSPVPVELLRGFIRNYTLSCTATKQPARREFVPGHAHRYSLENLLPGNYDIFMQANTDAGPGEAGRRANVHIGSEEISIVMYALVPLVLTSLALVLMACLAQSKMVKEKLCQDVPDPSHSSLAHWTPKTALESMKPPAVPEKTDIRYSEVILLGESEQDNCGPDKDVTYQSISNLQVYSTHRYSPLRVSGAQTPHNTRKSESNTERTFCPSIYSEVLFPQTLKCIPTTPLSPSDRQQSSVSINDVKLQLGGDSEASESLQGRSTTRSDSSLSQADELKACRHFLRQNQSPVSSSDLSSVSYSSILLSHPAEDTSPQHSFSRSHNNSAPSLQPDTFTRPDALSDTFATSPPPFLHSLFVDLSYCPVECEVKSLIQHDIHFVNDAPI